MQSRRDVLYEAYIVGMQSGDVERAMWCLVSHFVAFAYFLGEPIDHILEQCPKVVAQAEEVSQTSQVSTVYAMSQFNNSNSGSKINKRHC